MVLLDPAFPSALGFAVRLHFADVCTCWLVPAGCTHFIVGRDMAGSKSSITGEDFYGMYDAQVRPQHAALLVIVGRDKVMPAQLPSAQLDYTILQGSPAVRAAMLAAGTISSFSPTSQPLHWTANMTIVQSGYNPCQHYLAGNLVC
jgi:hypothetical protein